MDFPLLASFLNDLLSADYQGGRLAQKFLPGYREQQGRAQLAKGRAYDETVRQAKEMAAAKEMALRERANDLALANYKAERGTPMALTESVPNSVRMAPPQRPYPGQGAPVHPPINQSRPYPGQGAPVRPPLTPDTASVSPPTRRPAPQRAAPQSASPQDYFELLRRGQFRLG